MEIEGVIEVLKDTNQVRDKFKKRELVIVTDETYPQYISIEFQQDKCEMLDKYSVGQKVTIGFNLRGRSWEDKAKGETRYFNTIQGWKIQSLGSAPAPQQAQAPTPALIPVEDDSQPF